jgi:UDP:flavonoid glycosyltransferase YjiC (YdhE family)
VRRLLLAWELGGGMGHVVSLRKIAARLASQGFEAIAAVKDISAGAGLAESGIEVLQAPSWAGPSLGDADTPVRQSSATMGDVLASHGLGNEAVLASVIDAWLALIARIKPDLIVGDYAPGITLAARGRIPLGLRGSGYSLPPSHMQRFPALHRLSEPLWREEELVDSVNRVLQRHGTPGIERLPQVFQSDAAVVNTFPSLDPYRQVRLMPADGPFLDRLPELRRPGAEGIFVYLSPRTSPPQHVIEALRPHAPRLRIYAPPLAAEVSHSLEVAGATVFKTPQPVEAELCNNRLVVHYGVAGMASAALLAGVPQLLLSLDIEKDLTGQALESLGVGRLLRIHDPASRLTPEFVGGLLGDGILARRAERVAQEHRLAFNSDPLARFAADCVGLAA